MSKVNLECAYPYQMENVEDMKKAQEWIGKIVQSAGLEDDLVSYRFDLIERGKESEAGSLEALVQRTDGKTEVLFECVYCFVRKQTSDPAHTRIVLFRGEDGVRCRVSTEHNDAVEKIKTETEQKAKEKQE
ncbi:MAG: hypothetical protein WCP73_08445 [Eubacteriales bacterium]